MVNSLAYSSWSVKPAGNLIHFAFIFMLDSLIQALQTVIAALTTGITRPLKPLVIFTGQSSRARSVMLPTEGSIEAWEERRNGLGAGAYVMGKKNPCTL